MLYSLVALGFVLIFKASGVFNFAQGAMVLFAGAVRSLGLLERGVPLVARARRCRVVDHGRAGLAIERLVLRPLVNQDGIILFMATLGITFFLDGSARRSAAATSTRSTSASRRTPDVRARERVPRRHPDQQAATSAAA